MLRLAVTAVVLVAAVVGGGWFATQSAVADPSVAACEARLLPALLSPSSYKRIGATTNSSDSVLLEYDADNAGGAAVRSSYRCQFRKDFTGARYFADDPYWDWLACETTGRAESPGADCDEIRSTWVLFGMEIKKGADYPVIR